MQGFPIELRRPGLEMVLPPKAEIDLQLLGTFSIVTHFVTNSKQPKDIGALLSLKGQS